MDFKPYSKEYQLRGHKKKDKDMPKLKVKKPKKTKPKINKNVEVYQNRVIPHWKQRGAVHRKEGNKTLRYYGEECAVCGYHEYSLHHVMHKGYGIGGRGVWTNLVPLCANHHTGKEGVHTIQEHDQYWKDRHEKQFGPHYYKDKYDLWIEKHIENPTDELYQKFMRKEIEKAKGHQDNITVNSENEQENGGSRN